MLWCRGAQNIGLSNHELRALKCTVYDYNADRQTDGRTERRTNIISIAQRTHRALKTKNRRVECAKTVRWVPAICNIGDEAIPHLLTYLLSGTRCVKQANFQSKVINDSVMHDVSGE